jgi:hypothetical protein
VLLAKSYGQKRLTRASLRLKREDVVSGMHDSAMATRRHPDCSHSTAQVRQHYTSRLPQ